MDLLLLALRGLLVRGEAFGGLNVGQQIYGPEVFVRLVVVVFVAELLISFFVAVVVVGEVLLLVTEVKIIFKGPIVATSGFRGNAPSERFLQLGIGHVIRRRLKHKSEVQRNRISFVLDILSKLDEALVNHKAFFHVLQLHSLEPIQDLCDHDVEDVVDFDKVQEDHVDEVLEQSLLLAKVFVLKNVDYLLDELVELIVDNDDVARSKFFDVPWNFSYLFGEETRFGNEIDQTRDVLNVLLRQQGDDPLFW